MFNNNHDDFLTVLKRVMKRREAKPHVDSTPALDISIADQLAILTRVKAKREQAVNHDNSQPVRRINRDLNNAYGVR